MTVFPVLAGEVQLNHAGVAPLPRPVADAMRAYLDDWSWHGPKPWAYHRIGVLRGLAARAIGAASAQEIAVVPNTSTGLATVAAGLALGDGDVVVTTGVEFPANRYPWEDRRRDGATLVVIEPTDPTGRLVDDAAIVRAMREAFPRHRGTKLLAISHVQFSTGQEHDAAMLCAEARALGGLVCLDAIQSVGQMPLRVDECGVDFLAADGHKWMLGPEGCGVLYVRQVNVERLRPPLVGWFSTVNALDWDHYDVRFAEGARRYEPGCLSLVGVAGLAAGVGLLLEGGLDRVQARVRELAMALAERAERAGLAVVSRHGEGVGNGIVSLDAGGEAANRAVEARLRAAGIHGAVRRGVLRLSPHFYNTMEQVERVGEVLEAEAARRAQPPTR